MLDDADRRSHRTHYAETRVRLPSSAGDTAARSRSAYFARACPPPESGRSPIAALEAVRAPRLLVHDGHLFDAMDHRQVAWPLNIRARLAEEYGFQYIVAMNLDFLASVDGGLFGFRFG